MLVIIWELPGGHVYGNANVDHYVHHPDTYASLPDTIGPLYDILKGSPIMDDLFNLF